MPVDYDVPLLKTLIRPAEVLTGNGVPYCLVGGLAVSIVARPRTTEDIDLAVDIDPARRDELESLLKEQFRAVQTKAHVLDFENARVWRAVLGVEEHEEGIIIVDFIFGDNPVHRNASQHADQLGFSGTVIPVAKPEDLVVMKLLAGRTKDQLDVEAIREELAEDLDEDYISTMLESFREWKKRNAETK